jgi:hypothetical protein
MAKVRLRASDFCTKPEVIDFAGAGGGNRTRIFSLGRMRIS